MILYQTWGPRKPIIHANFVLDHSLKRKSNFLQKFDFIWKLFNAFKTKSFFLVFSLLIHSINSQQVDKQETRNPSQKHNPYFVKNFQELWTTEFCFPASFSLFQPSKRVQGVRLSKDASLLLIKASRIVPYTCIHIQFFFIFALLLSAHFNWF